MCMPDFPAIYDLQIMLIREKLTPKIFLDFIPETNEQY